MTTIEERVLARLREFAGDEPQHVEGAEATDLTDYDEGDTYDRVNAALHRLKRKGLAASARWTGARGEGTAWLWYPERGSR